MINQLAENINLPEKGGIDYDDAMACRQYLEKEFPGIKPTSKEIFDGMLSAYKAAVLRMENEEKQRKMEERRQSITRMWTYEEMWQVALLNGKAIAVAEDFRNGFVIDEYNKPVFHLLCLYFTNDKRFEEYGLDGVPYSLNKGIWLQSTERGSGKSTLLKCFRINKRCCFGYQHTTELGNKFQRQGYSGIDPFLDEIPQPSSASNFYQRSAGMMYDEMFGEGKVNHMGTPLMVSEYIINKLYDFSTNKKGNLWKFHCTSNSSGEDIERISGLTYRSRMPDMYNLIKLSGPNRRVS